MKSNRITSIPVLASLALFWISFLTVHANDWTAGVGDWSNAANWNGGVPNTSGGWAIGNIGNGGTAWVTTTVPHVNEAWAGNNGVTGTIIVTNGGVLNVDNWLVAGRYGGGGNTPLSTILVTGTGIINKAGDGFIVGDDSNCKGQVIVSGNGQILVTGGYNQIGLGWNSVNEGWLYLRDNGVFSTPAYDINFGDWGNAHGHGYIQDNATLIASRFWIGRWDNTVGALRQSGGSMIGSGAAANEWCLGGEGSGSPNAFGYYELSGGTMTCPFNFQVGRYGKGILYQSGGTNTQSGWCDTARYGGSLGVTWISGGLFQHNGTTTRYMVGETGRGEVTLSGSGVLDTAAPLMMANGTAYLTLNGGTLRVPEIGKWGGQAYINFNGGTVQAKADDASFLASVMTEARIYPGNAIFDTAGYQVTVAQSLTAAADHGVTGIPISDGGVGYFAPPIVQISGDGLSALALAQIDPVAGTVTNIIVTCPGHGYSTASATLIGGGATTAATLGTPTIGPIGTGGVIKNGLGILTLSGGNTYDGPTVVNQGTLITTPNSTGMGAVSVANGAGFGVMLPYAYGQIFVSSVTLGTSSGTSLPFDLGAFGNPLSPPLIVIGNLAVNGTVTVNIADALPQLGQVPLVQYGTRSGSGSFVLGSLPPGVQGTLVDDTVNKLVYLNITSVGLPRWEGLAGGTWDINVTTNWIEQSTGLPTFYKDGAPALFDDEALGTTTVNLVTNVKPASVTVTNPTLSYTLVGTGKVSGATSLIKEGAGSLTVANTNDYTGPTRIAGGTLSVTNLADGGTPSAIGKSSAAATNLVLANGTLSYSGPPVTINRGYLVANTNSAINTLRDLTLSGTPAAGIGAGFVKTGPAKLTYIGTGVNEISGNAYPGYNVAAGTTVFDGSAGSQINHSTGELWIGGTPDSGADLILTNTTLNSDTWVAVTRGNGSTGNHSSLSLYNSKLTCGGFSIGYDAGLSGNLASGTLTLNGNSTMTNNFDSNLAESGGSSASVFLNDHSILYSANRLFVGWHDSATGTVAMANSSKMYINAWFSIGNEGGNGSFSLRDNSSLWILWDLNVTDVGLGTGAFSLQDTASVDANCLYVAKGVGSTGTFTQTGGTVHTRGGGSYEFQVGVHGPGTYTLSGGAVNSDANWTSIGRYSDGTGVLNVSGGTFSHNDTGRRLMIGEEGNGTLNVSGSGLVRSVGDYVPIGQAATATGLVNLDGGTLEVRRIAPGAGSSTFNFNGGLLRAGANAHADFMSGLTSAYVKASGARIDASSNTITVAQALLDGGGGGGLTKTGNGTLILNGANTYTGPTLVSAGALGGNGTIAGPVTVADGAWLAPGTSIGLLTVNNTLVLAGGSTTFMELNKTAGTNDSVQGVTSLTYGGTLVLKNLSGLLAVNDTFKLFAATTYTGAFTNVISGTPGQVVTWDISSLAVNGKVRVATAVPVPVSITSSTSGGVVYLGWPMDQTGWLLQVQTNAPGVGISTNWVTVPASAATNQVSFPIISTNGSVFFRLLLP